jgi:Xaa-Pro aminopeptidase
MTRDIEQDLVNAAWPYWEAEGEIARRFFAKASTDDHVFYLRAQLWKELNPVDGFFNGLHRELARLVEIYPRVDKDVDRHDYHFQLLQLAQEFNHYVLLADVYEHLVGRKITPADTVQLPEEKKLGELRRRYVQSGSPIDRAAVGLTEGGGARLFREGAKLSGSPLNDMTARAMQVIYDDEKDHYLEQAKEAVRLVRSPADLERMKAAIRAISEQRVRMRQEMLRGAMTEAEIAAFIAANRREAA